MKNLVAAVFRLENSRTPADIIQVLTALIDWLQAPEQSSLRRAFTVWLQRVLLPRRMPRAHFPELTELHEVRTMLAERVQEWTKEWQEQGIQQGIQRGEALILERLLERKFGPLTEAQRLRLKTADAGTLLTWSERVLAASSVDEVLR